MSLTNVALLQACLPNCSHCFDTSNCTVIFLTFTNSTFCPHSVFMCFVWIWEQTAIISLYSINWLVFITETECVYCAVRSESLHKTDMFRLQRVKTEQELWHTGITSRRCSHFTEICQYTKLYGVICQNYIFIILIHPSEHRQFSDTWILHDLYIPGVL